jgi:hypothetical protein
VHAFKYCLALGKRASASQAVCVVFNGHSLRVFVLRFFYYRENEPTYSFKATEPISDGPSIAEIFVSLFAVPALCTSPAKSRGRRQKCFDYKAESNT